MSPNTSEGMKYPNRGMLSSSHSKIPSQVKSVTFNQQRGQFRELEVSHSAQVIRLTLQPPPRTLSCPQINFSLGHEAHHTPSSYIGRFEPHVVVQPTLGSYAKDGELARVPVRGVNVSDKISKMSTFPCISLGVS